MNENEIIEEITNALRMAKRAHSYTTQPEAEKRLVDDVLEEFATILTDNMWPRSEESPLILEEWAVAIKGE